MFDQERKEKLKKLGKKLGADAILLVKEKSRKVSMASSFIKAGPVGSIDIPKILSFEVVSSKTGQTMYYQ